MKRQIPRASKKANPSPQNRKALSPDLTQNERDYVLAIAQRYMKNLSDAEDVAQDALLLAFRHRKSFRGQSKYSTWLYRVASTTALMHLRSKQRKSREISGSSLSDWEQDWLMQMKSHAPSPEARVAGRERLEQVQHAIDKLDPKYAKLMHLRWFEELSEREISERMQLPLSTIKTRSYRGRQHVLSECCLAA